MAKRYRCSYCLKLLQTNGMTDLFNRPVCHYKGRARWFCRPFCARTFFRKRHLPMPDEMLGLRLAKAQQEPLPAPPGKRAYYVHLFIFTLRVINRASDGGSIERVVVDKKKSWAHTHGSYRDAQAEFNKLLDKYEKPRYAQSVPTVAVDMYRDKTKAEIKQTGPGKLLIASATWRRDAGEWSYRGIGVK